VSQEQRQKEEQQKLAEFASDLGKQGLRQNEQRKKLTANSELHKQEERHKLKRDKLKQKREQKSVEPKVLGSKQDESGTI